MTNAATVTETNLHGALDDEEFFIIEGSSCTEQQKKCRKLPRNGELVEIMSRFQRASRAEEKLQPEASTVHTSPFKPNGERPLQDSSSPQHRKC